MLHVVEGTQKSKTTLLKRQFSSCGKDAKQHLTSFLSTSYAHIMVARGHLAALLERERRETQRMNLKMCLEEMHEMEEGITNFEEMLNDSSKNCPPPKDAS